MRSGERGWLIRIEKISRRSVLKGLGIAGGLVLAAPVMSRQAFAAYQTGAGKMPHGTVIDPRVFVAIASDGTVTIVAHRHKTMSGSTQLWKLMTRKR